MSDAAMQNIVMLVCVISAGVSVSAAIMARFYENWAGEASGKAELHKDATADNVRRLRKALNAMDADDE